MQGAYEFKQSLLRLAKDFKYSCVVVITLALTLAISLMLFAIVYAVAYKPLPQAPEPAQLAWGTLSTSGATYVIGGLSNYNFDYLKQHQTKLEHFGRIEQRSVTVATDQFTDQMRGAAVSSSLFAMLAVQPSKGRTLQASDDLQGSARNVVISYRLWDTLFNQTPDILNQIFKLDGEAASIVGVMPEGFRFPIDHDVWFTDPNILVGDPADGGWHGGWNSVFGRLKPGASMSDVNIELKRLFAEIQKQYPNEYKGKGVEVMAFTKRFADNQVFLLSILKVASFAILAMGCFSVCNLIILRNLENAKEVLIKSALGAPWQRLVAGQLLETFWLCLSAAGLGIFLCWLCLRYLGENFLDGPYWWTLEFQAPLLATGAIAALAIWLATALIPLWLATRQPTGGLLASGRKGGTGTTLSRVMLGFSTLQIFSAFILMVFTGVLIGGLIRMASADYGVPREGYLVAEVKLAGENYAALGQRYDYYQRFVEQAGQHPRILGAAVAGALPGSGGYLSTYTSSERNLEMFGGFPKANETPVNDTYFDLMTVAFIEGRNFTAADREGAEEVAIINKTMADILFPGETASGRQFQYDPERGGGLLTVVGVVPDLVSNNPLWYFSSASEAWRSQLYRPIGQMQPVWDVNTLVFKVDGNPYEVIDAVKAIARGIDAEIPLYQIQSYDDFLAERENGLRRLILTFAPAALLALVIAALGIYSLTRRVVLQNTPDIGIMRAIGVPERMIDRKYLGSAALQLLIGVAAGVAFAYFLLPALPNSIIIANVPTILAACAAVAVVISVLVLVASYVPLLGAHKMSPREAMNYLSLTTQ